MLEVQLVADAGYDLNRVLGIGNGIRTVLEYSEHAAGTSDIAKSLSRGITRQRIIYSVLILIEGLNRNGIYFFIIGFIALHGIQGSSVIGIGEVYYSRFAVLTEEAVVIEVTGKVAGGGVVVGLLHNAGNNGVYHKNQYYYYWNYKRFNVFLSHVYLQDIVSYKSFTTIYGNYTLL